MTVPESLQDTRSADQPSPADIGDPTPFVGGRIQPPPPVQHEKSMFVTYLLVALGGAIGSVARFWCSGLVANTLGQTFPWGTLLVNIVGSFVIGFIATLTGPDGRLFVPSDARTFVMVGICGGFTPQAAEVFADFPDIRRIRVEDGPGKRLGRSFRVKLWPTFVFLRDGQVLGQVSRPSVAQLRAGLEQLSGEDSQ